MKWTKRRDYPSKAVKEYRNLHRAYRRWTTLELQAVRADKTGALSKVSIAVVGIASLIAVMLVVPSGHDLRDPEMILVLGWCFVYLSYIMFFGVLANQNAQKLQVINDLLSERGVR